MDKGHILRLFCGDYAAIRRNRKLISRMLCGE